MKAAVTIGGPVFARCHAVRVAGRGAKVPCASQVGGQHHASKSPLVRVEWYYGPELSPSMGRMQG